MAKKKPMGEGLTFRGTAADAVAAVNDDTPQPPRSSRKKGLEKVMYRLEPRQIAALRSEAFRRAQERSTGRPDASEVLREVLDAWLSRGGKRP
jgi:hypothetical protein